MPTAYALRQSLIAASRRYSRVAHEVEDLAHDIIVSALRRGSFDDEALLRSLHGAARRHAAFLARSAARRRAREAWVAGEHLDHGEADAGEEPEGTPLSALPTTLQTTLLLLLAGLEKAELRYTLGVSDAALRKRFQALRARGPLARPELPDARTSPALRRAQVGVLARLALAGGGEPRRVLAASDPDGHGIIFAESLTRGGRTATR